MSERPIFGVLRLDRGPLSSDFADRLRKVCLQSGVDCYTDQGMCIGAPRLVKRAEYVIGIAGAMDAGRLEFEETDGFSHWGERLLEESWEFSLVVWHGRDHRIFWATDTSSRSLYYGVQDGLLIVASEIDLFFEIAQWRRVADKTTIGIHLANRIFDPAATLFDNVKRIPPGHMLVGRREGVEVRRYWELRPVGDIACESDDDYADEFRRILRDAIKDRIGPGENPGLLLSGGLDSSAIACVAKESGCVLPALSVVSTKQAFDESEFAREMSAWTGAVHTQVEYEREIEPYLKLEHWGSVDVLYSPMMRFCEALFQAAAKAGHTVLLTGFGGDELLSTGYGYLNDLARGLALRRLWKQAGSDAKTWGTSRSELLWRQVIRPRIADRNTKNGCPSFIKEEFLESSGALEFVRSQRAPEFPRREQHQIYWALRYGWNIAFQLEQIESVAGACGVELRHPFLDRRVIDFVVGLPDEQRHRAEGDRFILRHAMCGLMPERVRTRVGKSDLAGVIDAELRTKQAEMVRELFRDSRLAAMGAIDGPELLAAFDRFSKGSRAVHASDFETLVGFEVWLRNLEKQ